jgi:hypothetical protein
LRIEVTALGQLIDVPVRGAEVHPRSVILIGEYRPVQYGSPGGTEFVGRRRDKAPDSG